MPRLVLVPGLRVLPRGPDEVQIGLDPRRRVRLALDGGARRVLAALDRGESLPTDPASRRASARLAGVLVDADLLRPATMSPGDAAAAAAAGPEAFAGRLRARSLRKVAVRDELGVIDPKPLLAAAGVRVVEDDDADLMLLLSAGEPDRAALDPLVRAGTAHQLVRAVEGELVVGPLVVPGSGACLRCLDAHHGSDDPLHPVLAATHHRAGRHDGVAEPVDSALATMAIGWAVRDVIAHLDGDSPATWSATARIGADLDELSVVHWLRHPACGCIWSEASDRSATMEA